MFPFALLLAAALSGGQTDQAEVRVSAPGKPNAQTPATLVVEPAAMLIVACDADADGRTTRGELDGCLTRSFAAGGTGNMLSYIDYGVWQKKWLGDQGALPSPFEVDRDGDGEITLEELQAQFGKLFARFDKDGDKGVTRAEALTIRAAAADGRGGAPRGKKGERPRGERIPGGRPEDAPGGQP